jgi:hypothetical protein
MKRLFAQTMLLFLVLAPPQAGRAGGSVGVNPPAAVIGPRIVLIIRHAEKPDDPNDPNLSPRGMERAAALATVIPRDFPKPDFLLATKRSAHSNRPFETLEPLGKRLHLPIDSSYLDKDFAGLAHQVLTDPKYAGKVVLIAWHHGKIASLAHALGASSAPDKWNSQTFDRVWQLSYAEGTATWKDLPQKALPGDAKD